MTKNTKLSQVMLIIIYHCIKAKNKPNVVHTPYRFAKIILSKISHISQSAKLYLYLLFLYFELNIKFKIDFHKNEKYFFLSLDLCDLVKRSKSILRNQPSKIILVFNILNDFYI